MEQPPRHRVRTTAIVIAVVLASLVILGAVGNGIRQESSPFDSPPYPRLSVDFSQHSLSPSLTLGQATGPLITPTQATAVARALWTTREDALLHRQIGLIKQIETGSIAGFDLWYLEGLEYGLTPTRFTAPRPADAVTVFVPRQTTWPAYFGFSVSAVPLTRIGAATAFLVATRAGPTDSWKIAFVIGGSGSQPNFVIPPPNADAQGYDAVPTALGQPAGTWFGQLTNYYATWKDTGKAPSPAAFAPGVLTTQQGQQMASRPQGYVSDDGVASSTYRYSGPSSAHQWSIGIAGVPMVCGDISESVTYLPREGGLLHPADRYGWGPQVAPGDYQSVVIGYDFSVCVFPSYSGPYPLGVIGNVGNQISSFGVH
jgi:hypothetical protein